MCIAPIVLAPCHSLQHASISRLVLPAAPHICAPATPIRLFQHAHLWLFQQHMVLTSPCPDHRTTRHNTECQFLLALPLHAAAAVAAARGACRAALSASALHRRGAGRAAAAQPRLRAAADRGAQPAGRRGGPGGHEVRGGAPAGMGMAPEDGAKANRVIAGKGRGNQVCRQLRIARLQQGSSWAVLVGWGSQMGCAVDVAAIRAVAAVVAHTELPSQCWHLRILVIMPVVQGCGAGLCSLPNARSCTDAAHVYRYFQPDVPCVSTTPHPQGPGVAVRQAVGGGGTRPGAGAVRVVPGRMAANRTAAAVVAVPRCGPGLRVVVTVGLCTRCGLCTYVTNLLQGPVVVS